MLPILLSLFCDNYFPLFKFLVPAATMAVITELFENPYVLQGLAAAIFLVYVSHFLRDLSDGFPYKNIPLVGKTRWELSNTKAKERFVNSANELIQQGFSQVRSLFMSL